MARFHVVVVEPSDDDEVETKTLLVTADSMDVDPSGLLAFTQGPAGSAKIVAVFSPQSWLRAYERGQAGELAPPSD
jgi:hypothetical protein